MSTRHLEKVKAWAPYLLTAGIILLSFLAFRQARADWNEWKEYKRGPARLADMPPGTLAWQQPLEPAQFAQSTCGACHRETLPQTPRLNRGRQLIVKFNCIGCHQLQDIDRPFARVLFSRSQRLPVVCLSHR